SEMPRCRPWNDGCDGARGAIPLRQSDLEVDGAILTEVPARLTRPCVHGDQAHVERSLDDAFRAALAGRGTGIGIIRYTTTRRGVPMRPGLEGRTSTASRPLPR